MDSMEGRGGRTPRPASSRRLYRGLRAATDAPPGAPEWNPCRAEGALTSGCIALHYSPGFVYRTRVMTAPTLSVALAGAVVDIECRPESLGMGYLHSLEGPGGRTPRPASSGRLYRGLRAATHTYSGDRARMESLSRRRRTYIQVYRSPLQSRIRVASAGYDRA